MIPVLMTVVHVCLNMQTPRHGAHFAYVSFILVKKTSVELLKTQGYVTISRVEGVVGRRENHEKLEELGRSSV